MRVSQAVLLTCVIRTKGGQRSSGEPAKQISLRQKEAFLHAAPGRGVGRPPPGKEDTRPPWKHADAGRGKHSRFHPTRALLCLQKHFNTKRTPLAFTLFCTLWSPPPCSRPPQSRFHFKCKASGSPQGSRQGDHHDLRFVGLFLAALGLPCCGGVFLQLRGAGLLPGAVHGLLTGAASPVESRRSRMSGLSCNTGASVLRCRQDLPGPGTKLASPALAGGLLTPGSPGKPFLLFFSGNCNSSPTCHSQMGLV